MTDSVDSLLHSFQCLSLSGKDHVLWTIPNIHKDDVHGLILTGDRHIVSGSKDGSIVKTSLNGFVVKSQLPPYSRDYTKWMTALAKLDDSRWLQGTRDGRVLIMNNDLNPERSWTVAPKTGHTCKERNLFRIMSFGVFQESNPNNPFFVGQATEFSIFDQYGRAKEKYSADQNDWVYVLKPLSPEKMLIVTGSNMALWKKDAVWHQETPLVTERTRFASGQRPYISSVVQTASHVSQFAYTVFDGSTRILDIETQQHILVWHEHVGRVWSVVNCCNGLFGTCADDKTVKLWDLRTSRSVFTFSGHPGRVSSLLAFDTSLVAATCPYRPTEGMGAVLVCRDLRGI